MSVFLIVPPPFSWSGWRRAIVVPGSVVIEFTFSDRR